VAVGVMAGEDENPASKWKKTALLVVDMQVVTSSIPCSLIVLTSNNLSLCFSKLLYLGVI